MRKLTANEIFWTTVRGCATLFFLGILYASGDAFEGMTQGFLRRFRYMNLEETLGRGIPVILFHYLAIQGLRSTLENAKFDWFSEKGNPFRKLDFSGWKDDRKQGPWKGLSSKPTSDEDHDDLGDIDLYGIPYRELKSGNVVDDVFAKAFSEFPENTKQAEARYIQYRVLQLKKERIDNNKAPKPGNERRDDITQYISSGQDPIDRLSSVSARAEAEEVKIIEDFSELDSENDRIFADRYDVLLKLFTMWGPLGSPLDFPGKGIEFEKKIKIAIFFDCICCGLFGDLGRNDVGNKFEDYALSGIIDIEKPDHLRFDEKDVNRGRFLIQQRKDEGAEAVVMAASAALKRAVEGETQASDLRDMLTDETIEISSLSLSKAVASPLIGPNAFSLIKFNH